MEWVMEVDEENREVGSIPRNVMRSENRIHRASFIYILVAGDSQNTSARFIIQKRAAEKDYCPSYYDLATGGVLQPHEDYEENAKRELEEELGLDGTSDSMYRARWYWLGVDFHSDERCRVWGGIYLLFLPCSPEEDLCLQKEEVESVQFMTPLEIDHHEKSGTSITPDSLHFYHTCLQRAQELVPDWNFLSSTP